MNILLALATALPMVVSAGAATAGTYSGNWPLTVSQSQHGNGTYCVTITDDGSFGWPHSGLATLNLDGNQLFGTFQLIDHDLTITNEDPGGNGQNAGLVFVAHAANGAMTNGVYDEVYGGEEFDSGVLTVGKKGGC
jgi:hypothetical protein